MKLPLALLLGACLALTGCASTTSQPLSSQQRSALDAYLSGQVGPGEIPGMVAMVVDARQVLYLNAFGQQDVARNLPMRTDSIFRIASMTKPVTAVAALMLVDEGRLDLDDPVARYLPEFASRPVMVDFDAASRSYRTRPAASPMTVRHLATHTSGLAYPFSNSTLATLAAGGAQAPTDYPLLHDPGTRWTYGESTRVLGRIIEVVSGQPLDAFLQQRLFDPLAMRDTSFTTTADRVARVATIHRRVDGRLVETPNAPNAQGAIASPVQGDGGLNSTAGDYAKFMQLLLNDGVTAQGRRLLSRRAVAMVNANHTGNVKVELQPAAIPALSESFPLGAGRDTFGMAVQVTGTPAEPGLRRPGSYSWAGIFNTEFWVDPETGIGAVLLMQYLPFYDAAAIRTLQGFERRVYEAADAR